MSLAPLAAIGWLVHKYGVNVPYQDQFELVPLFKKSSGSGLSFRDVWAQHNEHRMVVPKLVMLGLAKVSRWNIRLELFTSLLIAALSFRILYRLLKRTLEDRASPVPLHAVLVAGSVMVFSPVQWDNWMGGWQMQWHLSVLALVSAVAVLALWPQDRPQWPGFLLACTSAAAGQLSIASGVLIWPACLIILLARRRLRRFVFPWIAVGSALTVIYLRDYQSPRTPILSDPLDRLGEAASFVLYYLGRPVLYARPGIGPPNIWPGAAFLGAFLFASAYFIFQKRQKLELAAPWIGLGLYAIGGAVLTAAGRAGSGAKAAEPSRYTTVAVLLMLSVLALVALILVTREAPAGEKLGGRLVRKTLILMAAGSLAAPLIFHYRAEVNLMRTASADRARIRDCLINASGPEEPCLLLAYPDPRIAYERAQYLKRIGWGGLS